MKHNVNNYAYIDGANHQIVIANERKRSVAIFRSCPPLRIRGARGVTIWCEKHSSSRFREWTHKTHNSSQPPLILRGGEIIEDCFAEPRNDNSVFVWFRNIESKKAPGEDGTSLGSLT